MASASEQSASSPPSWRQRTCRWLWRVLRFFWVSVVFVLFMAVLPSLLLLTPSTPPPYIVGFWVNWVLPHLPIAVLVLLGLVGLTILSWVGSRERTGSLSLSADQQSRVDILKALRKAYTDELAASLQGLARIPLRLHEHFGLTHPARLVTWPPGQPERALSAGTTIVDAYDQAGNGLLILGEPGVGKSTLLYDLAQALLSRAEQNEQDRFPVILNLSSWATKRLPLETWLLGELQRRYGIPRSLGRQLKLLLLLDGLDEVAATARDACIKAINTYHSERLVPLVVCSRRGEYEALPEQLTLQSAVVVQPLFPEQVKDYLATAGEALAAVRTVIEADPVLEELLTTPLMVSVIVLAYRGRGVEDLPRLGTAEQQQQQIFADYVERVLNQRAKKGDYTPQQTRQWLTWLAQRLQQFSLTEFYLEWLQPTWLATKQVQDYYPGLVGVLVGVLIGLVSGLIYGLVSGLIYGLVSGLVVGLLSESGKQEIRFVEAWSWRGFWRGLVFGLSGELGLVMVFGLGFVVVFILLRSLVLVPYSELLPWLVVGLLNGLVVGLGRRGSDMQITNELRRRPNQGISRSGRDVLLFGLVGGLLFGLVGWLVVVLLFGLVVGLLAGLLSWLVVRLFNRLIFRLGRRGSGMQITNELRRRPNQGISRSGRNALLFGLVGGLGGPVVGLLVGGPVVALLFGLFSGPLGGPVVGLLVGGLLFWLVVGLVVGLVGGLVGWLGFRLFNGLVGGLGRRGSDMQITNDLRRRPNQGISRSGRIALLFGLVGGLVVGPFGGLFSGLVGGLVGGGRAYLQHYFLRFLLWRSGALPWHYIRFLEGATERILLQRIGGGYRFIHPLFQEYFASGAARDIPVAEPLPTQQP
jgi:hypothetical protein